VNVLPRNGVTKNVCTEALVHIVDVERESTKVQRFPSEDPTIRNLDGALEKYSPSCALIEYEDSNLAVPALICKYSP
jgi:hypothetical protein